MAVAKSLLAKVKNIKLLVLDVDGVLTDGGLYFDDKGGELRRFSTLDGYGITTLKKFGIEVAVISAKNTNSVSQRMKGLGIEHCYQGYHRKEVALAELLTTLRLKNDSVAYVGDDLLDLPVMKRVKFSVAVANAHHFIKERAHYITKAKGGHGAVREVCDLILSAQGYDKKLIDSLFKEAQITSFQAQCYLYLLEVPRGKVTTYGAIACAIGKPKATRAVGSAMRTNPYSPIVPCHRVVESSGKIGNYARGVAKKIALLTAENISIDYGKIQNKTQFFEFTHQDVSSLLAKHQKTTKHPQMIQTLSIALGS